MNTKQAREEFYQLINDDDDFYDFYENNENGFLLWLADYEIIIEE